jgi:CTP:molybdopterin cytidylyltransferase MocA/HD superfamily phosphohydrolase YqeK
VEVCLVVGHRQDELRAGIQTQDIQIVANPDYAQGMFTSIRRGLRYLQADYQGVFIAPVDIPLVRPFTIQRLLTAAEEYPDKLIYPVFHKIRGHPPLIPAHIFPSILGGQEDSSLKSVLHHYENVAREVSVPDGNILFDIDDPDDYKMLLERFQRYEVPTGDECEAIMKDVCQVAPHLCRHGAKVAEVADSIGRALIMAGINIDLDALHAAAVLHDMAKGQPDHDAAGARILREMGFGKVADMVLAHTDLPEETSSVSLETKVVYLADKFVVDERLVPFEERYRSARRRFGATADVTASIRQRLERAFNVKKEIELLLGRPLEKVLFK